MNVLEFFKLAAPEGALVLTALLVLAADLLTLSELPIRLRFSICAMIAGAGCIGTIVLLFLAHAPANYAAGMFVVSPVTQMVKAGILVLTLFTILISIESDFTTHTGEFVALILLASVAMMFLVSAEDILMIFVALEMTSLSLYILTAFNKCSVKGSEAALKYFIFGGLSAAFTLFGLSFLYGLADSTNLREIAAAIGQRSATTHGFDPMLAVALVMVVIGFGFKVAAAPFHFWAPDAYEGAPAPSAAFIASGSKVAGFYLLAKVLIVGFAGAEGFLALPHYVAGWVPVIAVVAVVSMIVGNLAAIVQVNVRRLVAYSAVAHAGYVLLAILAGSAGIPALIYYVLTYGLTTIGAFGVIAVVERSAGGSSLADFAGLSRRAPLLSMCMFFFMLSLAGIPPLAGFFGKFYVFTSVVRVSPGDLRMIWLVVLALGVSAISLYYYLQVLKQIYVAGPSADAGRVNVPVTSLVALLLLAALILLLGCLPDAIISRFSEVASALPQ